MWFGSSTMLQCHPLSTPSSSTSCRPLNMRAHIAKTAQTCFYHLRQIQRLLGRDVACTVVRALVLSRIDYCNAVLSGLPQSTIAPLQWLLNAAARVVMGPSPTRSRHSCTDRTPLVTSRSTYRVQALSIGIPSAKRSCTVLHHWQSDVKTADTVKTFKYD